MRHPARPCPLLFPWFVRAMWLVYAKLQQGKDVTSEVEACRAEAEDKLKANDLPVVGFPEGAAASWADMAVRTGIESGKWLPAMDLPAGKMTFARFTMTERFAREPYEARGIVIHELAPGWRTEVDRIIFEELAKGRVVRDSQRKLKTLITELQKQKVQAVVLACTELVLAVDVRANVIPVYDTTAIHARAAVDWMLADEELARAAA